MMKSNQRKTKNNRSFTNFLFKLAAAGASVYLAFCFVSGQIEMAGKKQELAELEMKIEEVAESNKELQHLLDADDQDAYIERVAREKLRYARPDERIFVDLTGK